MDIQNRILPPVPRIARAADPARTPTPDLVEPYSKPAADVIRRIRDVWTTADAAIDALADARPDGRLFRDVEDQAVKDNNPQAIADLIAGEPMRYANAVVKARRAVIDQSDTRADGQKTLTAAAVKIRAHMQTLIEEFTTHAATAWKQRHRAAGLVALETAQQTLEHIRALRALADWCDGTDREFAGHKNTTLPPEAAGNYLAARWHHRPDGSLFSPPAGVTMPADWDPQPGRITLSGSAYAGGTYGIPDNRPRGTIHV